MVDLKRLVAVSTGKKVADLCIQRAQVVNVHTCEIIKTDVLIDQGVFAGFRSYGTGEATEIYDAHDKYMLPGFIDGHVHIESSQLSVPVFSQLLLRRGTTTVIADPHEIVNCCGMNGLDYMMKTSADIPLSVYFMIPSCVPCSPFETSGAVIEADEIAQWIDNPRILGLGELMNYPGVLFGDDQVMSKIDVAHHADKFIDGHFPSPLPQDLDAYVAMGIRDDHESTTASEAQEKLRRGMYLLVRQGTICQDEEALLPLITKDNFRHCLFCTDDRHAESLIEEGSIDNNVRLAIKNGLDLFIAISMATINSAECFHLDDRGAIDPGKRADFSLVEDLHDLFMHRVYVEGTLIAEDQKMQESLLPLPIDLSVFCTINYGDLREEKLVLPLRSNRVKTIGLHPHTIITEAGRDTVETKDGHFVYSPAHDVVKIAVVERHHGTGNVGLALLEGYGIKTGAIATTIAHDSHNIICCGTTDSDMYLAIKTLKENHGGLVLVNKGEVLAHVSLPIAGLMSNGGAQELADSIHDINIIAREKLGILPDFDPFMTLSFLALPVVPSYKITDKGLFDVNMMKFVGIENND